MAKGRSARRTAKPVRRRRFPYLVAILAFAIGFTGFLFVYIDKQVARVLEGRHTRAASGIYGDALEYEPGQVIAVADLRAQLLRRRYREVSERPSSPGEFQLAGMDFAVVTRSFYGADGQQRAPRRYSGIIQDQFVHLAADGPPVMLEPVPLTALGATDVRASSYQPLSIMPKELITSVLSIEDQRFYEHVGIDPVGILRAMLANLRAGRFVQGGSTLTQQLAKNLLLSPEKTLLRKAQEALAALSLERRLSKEQILELYLNEVYLGQEGSVALHGMAQAADAYFGKRVSDLSLGESAMLAGMIRAPSAYSPRRNHKRALERRDIVLAKLAEEGKASPAQIAAAKAEQPTIVPSKLGQRRAPYFASSLNSQLSEVIDVDAAALAGVTILSGLDIDVQECAEQAVAEGIKEVERRNPRLARKDAALQAALVAIEPFSGKVRAWVGGRDFRQSQFDRVVQSQRQVGSTIKPFLYLTALDGQLNDYRVATTTSILPDRPMEISLITQQTWSPENYDHKHRGDVTLRYALEHSLNLPAVYVAQKVGIAALARTIRLFRLSPNPLAVPSLALGALDTSLLNLTAAFAALANGGVYVAPRLTLAVLDSEGSVLYRTPLSEERIADERAVFVLTNILQGVVERGTARGVRGFGYHGAAAGKTGTSDEARDAWFVGFRPDLAAGVWVGFDDNSPLGLTGGTAAVPIWAKFMSCASKVHPEEKFLVPPGVHFIEVDSLSGELATSECPRESVITELFVEGTEPRRRCRLHAGIPGARDIEERSGQQETQPRKERNRGFWEMIFG